MKELPRNVKSYKKTMIYTEKTIPQAFLQRHNTKAGVWGKITVTKGKMNLVFEPEPDQIIVIDRNSPGVVPPALYHKVILDGEVEFYIEFYK